MAGRLFDLVSKNHYLRYIEVDKSSDLDFGNINFTEDFWPSGGKKLAFLYLDNSLDSINIFWNLIKSRHAAALLSPELNTKFKSNLESLFNPDFIYDTARSQIDGYSLSGPSNKLAYFINNKPKDKEIHESLKIMLSTSGTTGSPKFVKLSESNLVNNALSIIDYLPIKNDDITPLQLPIYYSYGLSILTANSIAGGKIVCSNKDITSKEFWKNFENLGYSSLAGIPFTYEILNRIGFTQKRYSHLRYLTQAGGKLNESLIKIFSDYAEECGVKFYVMYGQTEATARISYLNPAVLKDKIGSIGKPIKNGLLSIDEGTGELVYEGPNVFGGYATAIEDLADFSDNRILRTGDLGRVDQDGFFYITGRLKRFMKLNGARINLDEMESILKNNFIGESFICTGIDDRILMVGINRQSTDKASIVDYLKNSLNIHPSFIKVVYLEEIPLTQNGKINYTAISQRYESE